MGSVATPWATTPGREVSTQLQDTVCSIEWAFMRVCIQTCQCAKAAFLSRERMHTLTDKKTALVALFLMCLATYRAVDVCCCRFLHFWPQPSAARGHRSDGGPVLNVLLLLGPHMALCLLVRQTCMIWAPAIKH